MSTYKRNKLLKSKEIIYLITNPNFVTGRDNYIGGHISHAVGVIDAFTKEGFRVYIVMNGKLPLKENSPLVQYHSVTLQKLIMKIPFLGRIIWNIKCIYLVLQLVNKLQPSFIYARFSIFSFIVPIIALKKHTKVVLEVNTPAALVIKNKIFLYNLITTFLRRIDHLSFSSADIIVLVSRQLYKVVLFYYPKYKNKYIILPNAVNTRTFSPTILGKRIRKNYNIISNDIVIGFSGQFEYYDGIDLLIKAFKKCKDNLKEKKGIYLLLIGDGPMKTKLANLSAKLNLKNVIFTGGIPFDTMPKHLAACDILVSPLIYYNNSESHFSPIKLYEYMSMGKCVIVSDIGQQDEIIIDNVNGLKFKNGNMDSLFSKLIYAIKYQNKLINLCNQARKDVLRYYTWEKRVKELLVILEKRNIIND